MVEFARTPNLDGTEIYWQRNRVERFFDRIKHFRRIATRYEKYAHTFLAMIHLTAAFLYRR